MIALQDFEQATSSVSGTPRAILRLESGLVLTCAVMAFAWHSGQWSLFALLFLIPDLSMLGYLANARIGAICYNFAHAYVLPLAVGLIGVAYSQSIFVDGALIWIAHIGFDRMLGYGLKYGSAFGHTHLGQVGRARQVSGDKMGLPARAISPAHEA